MERRCAAIQLVLADAALGPGGCGVGVRSRRHADDLDPGRGQPGSEPAFDGGHESAQDQRIHFGFEIAEEVYVFAAREWDAKLPDAAVTALLLVLEHLAVDAHADALEAELPAARADVRPAGLEVHGLRQVIFEID